MAIRIYATVEDLRQWLQIADTSPGDEPDERLEDAEQVLRSASLIVDRVLRNSYYDTDDEGMPTDPDIRDALRDATCAQAERFIETGDHSGVSAAYSHLQLGGFSGTVRGAVTAGGRIAAEDTRVSPQVAEILAQAGLVSTTVGSAW